MHVDDNAGLGPNSVYVLVNFFKLVGTAGAGKLAVRIIQVETMIGRTIGSSVFDASTGEGEVSAEPGSWAAAVTDDAAATSSGVGTITAELVLGCRGAAKAQAVLIRTSRIKKEVTLRRISDWPR